MWGPRFNPQHIPHLERASAQFLLGMAGGKSPGTIITFSVFLTMHLPHSVTFFLTICFCYQKASSMRMRIWTHLSLHPTASTSTLDTLSKNVEWMEKLVSLSTTMEPILGHTDAKRHVGIWTQVHVVLATLSWGSPTLILCLFSFSSHHSPLHFQLKMWSF